LTLCQSLHAEAQHATVSEGLTQGRYVAARAGFKPATLWSKGIDSNMRHHAPLYGPCNHNLLNFYIAEEK